MQLTDTDKSYGLISIWLHWIGAAAMIVLYLTGESRATHIALGMILLLPLLLRLVWRIGSGRPEKPEQHRYLMILSNVVTYALLAAIAILIVTGPLVVWAGGRAIDVYGLSLPSPFTANRGLHEALEEIHGVIGNLVLPLFLLHVAGALKHAFVDRDGTFARMLRPAVLKRPAR